jgi:hypothetical protein
VAKLADARDLRSAGLKRPVRFDSIARTTGFVEKFRIETTYTRIQRKRLLSPRWIYGDA